MIWSQSLRGRAIDLIHPDPDDVDFDEIADMMAGTYRWCGTSERDISVALHTLIGLQLCEPDVAPYWILHDAHEPGRIGDITRPTQMALDYILGELGYPPKARLAIQEMAARHDEAIHFAAGLVRPGALMKQRVKLIDNTAMMIERRDFLVEPAQRWDSDLEAIAETLRAPKAKWLPKPHCAEAMKQAFREWLPCFNGGSGANAAPGEIAPAH